MCDAEILSEGMPSKNSAYGNALRMKASEKNHKQQISKLEESHQSIAGLKRSNSKLRRVEEALYKSETKLNKFLENINDVVFQLSPLGVIEYVSPKVKELYGYKPEELIGKHLKKTTPKSEMPKALKVLKTALTGKTVKNFEIAQLDKNGKIVHMEINGTPVKNNGTVTAVQGVMRDITERKQTEDTLRETSLFLRNILDSSSSISIVFTDLEQNILFWNKGAENIFGYKAEEVVGSHTVDILYPDDEKDIKQTVKEIRSFIVNKKRGIRRELKEVTKDGRTLWISLTSTPRLDEHGNVIGILGIGEDITDHKQAEEMLQKAHQELEKRVEERTAELSEKNVLLKKEISERKQMEEELRESAEKYHIITSTAMDGFAVTDVDGHILDVNEESCRILGYSSDEQLTMSISDLEVEKTPNEIKKHIQKVIEVGSDRFETRHRRKDGRIIDIEVSMTFMPQSKHFLVFHRDITDRKRAEEALLESERKWRSLYENLPGGTFIVNDQYIIEDVNDILCTLSGFTREELVGQLCNIICPKGPHKCPIFDLNKERIDNDKTMVKTKDGQFIPIIKSARRISMGAKEGIIENFQDITEMVRAEEAVRQSEERFRALYEDNPSMYFTVDAEGTVLSVNQFGAEQMGYTVKELVGQPVLNVFYEEDKKAVKQQLAICTQNPKKLFHWEFRKVRKDGKIIWVKETVRAIQSVDGNLVVLIVCEDITERKRADEKLKENFDTLSKSLESTVSALASALEMRDPYTAGHQQRVTDLACAIADDMGLGVEQIAGIRMAGLIHDIGKINIPAEILNKPGQLTELEYSLFKNHPQIGHDVLKTIEFPWPVAQIVLQHHERFDGSGYPQGLAGEEILLEARILAVADIVEAIASHRPYRPARGIGDALEEVLHNKGRLYDPEVVDACLRAFYEKGFTFEELAMVEAPVPKIH